MSQLQIKTVCTQCQKHFLSKKRRSKFCSNLCRAQYDRDKKSMQFKTQAKVIQRQAEIIKVVLPKSVDVKPVSNSRISGDYVKKYSDPAWLASTLEGIYFPSISKWQTGSLTEAERREIERTAKEMGMTVDVYMKDLEERIKKAPLNIAKLFH